MFIVVVDLILVVMLIIILILKSRVGQLGMHCPEVCHGAAGHAGHLHPEACHGEEVPRYLQWQAQATH
jgi:hypothetical protein